MKHFLPLITFVSVAPLVSTLDYRDQAHCCGNESVSLRKNSFYENVCENGQKPELFCRQKSTEVSHVSEDFHFRSDDDGKFMFVSEKHNHYSFAVRSPYYCVANRTVEGSVPRLVVLYCTDKTFSTEENSFDYEFLKNMLRLTMTLLYLASSLLLAIIAIIYFILPQTQKVEERCTFHITLNQSLFCLFAACRSLSDDGFIQIIQLREHCALHWYLFMFTVIAFFTWSALLSYQMWNRFRHISRIGLNESKVMFRYLLIGYGIPTLLVTLSNINAYWDSDSWSHYFHGGCSVHSTFTYAFIYGALPIFVIQGVCVYFFVSLQQKLWNMIRTNSPQHSTSNIQKFKFRLVLNAKLLLVTELPFLLITLSLLFMMLTESYSSAIYGIYGSIWFISVEGMILFYMLVVRRKRVLQGLAEKFGLTAASGWQPCPEEESTEDDNENENELNREL